jgi:hypothetical protein
VACECHAIFIVKDTPLSHCTRNLAPIKELQGVQKMFWKLTGLQKLLDALFEGSLFDLGVPEAAANYK